MFERKRKLSDFTEEIASAGAGVAGPAGGHRRDACLHGKQVGVAAAVERDVDDLFALDCLADLSVCGLNLRRILSDGDSLVRIHDVHNDIRRQRGVDVDLQICCLTVRIEAVCCHVELVLPDGHNGEAEYPLRIAGRGLSDSSRRIAQSHVAAWDHRTSCILYRSGDPAAPSLAERGTSDEKNCEESGKHKSDGNEDEVAKRAPSIRYSRAIFCPEVWVVAPCVVQKSAVFHVSSPMQCVRLNAGHTTSVLGTPFMRSASGLVHSP